MGMKKLSGVQWKKIKQKYTCQGFYDDSMKKQWKPIMIPKEIKSRKNS